MSISPPVLEVQSNGYCVSTDQDRLDFDVIHGFLRESYWSRGIPRHVVETAARHSLCFGVYKGADQASNAQVGYSRVITDYATFAYLADVFIVADHRGQGLGKWMMATIKGHPALQAIRHWVLFTADAHGLYAQFGFAPDEASADWLMTWRDPAYAALIAG